MDGGGAVVKIGISQFALGTEFRIREKMMPIELIGAERKESFTFLIKIIRKSLQRAVKTIQG